jgi:hypothetical protein
MTETAEAPPSIRYAIARAINNLLGVDLSPPEAATSQPEEPKVVAHANVVAAIIKEWDEAFVLGYNRKRRYQEYSIMDKGEIAAQLDDVRNAVLISDDGRMESFDVRAKGAKYQTIVDDVLANAGVHKACRSVLRDTLKFGDEFVEYIVDDNGDIVGVQSAPCETMYRNVDVHNRILQGAEEVDTPWGKKVWPRAFHQRNYSQRTVAAWYPWEMAHVRWEPSDKHIYSASSFLEPMRRDWHRINMTENGMTVARLVRAYLQKVHKIDVTGKDNEETKRDIEQYQNVIAKAKLSGGSIVDRPLGVDEDLFLGVRYHTQPDGTLMPSLNGIDAIDPRNAGLAEIEDMYYNRDKLFMYVPAEVVGMERDRSRDLSRQDVAVSHLYRYCQKNVLEEQFLWPMFRLALLLKGYNPKREDVEVVWPDVMVKFSWRHSDAFFRRIMGHANAIETGIVDRIWVRMNEYGMSRQEAEEMEANVVREADVYPEVERGSQAAQTRQGNQAT